MLSTQIQWYSVGTDLRASDLWTRRTPNAGQEKASRQVSGIGIFALGGPNALGCAVSLRAKRMIHVLISEGELSRSIDVCPMVDVDDSNCPAGFVDLVDDAIGANSCRVKPG